MRVTLDRMEARIATGLGRMRSHNARAKGIKDRKIGPQDAVEGDINGVGGEFAFCKACGVWPDLTVTPRSGGHDAVVFGTRFDVKTTKVPDGRLLAPIHKATDAVDAYVLVVGELPQYRIVGWAWSNELLFHGNKIDLNHGTHYGMNQSRLRPFSLLLEILKSCHQQVKERMCA